MVGRWNARAVAAGRIRTWAAVLVIAGYGFVGAGTAWAGMLSQGAFGAGYATIPTTAVHVVAFLAVGLWAGLHSGAAVWELPLLAAVGVVAAGIIADAGVALPYANEGLYASLFVLGLFVALPFGRLPLILAAMTVAVAMVFHGYPHARPIGDGDGVWYWLGMVAGGLLVSLAGVGLAGFATYLFTVRAVHGLGVAIMALGAFYLLEFAQLL